MTQAKPNPLQPISAETAATIQGGYWAHHQPAYGCYVRPSGHSTATPARPSFQTAANSLDSMLFS